MESTQVFSTKLPKDLTVALHKICERFGLKKNFVIEQAVKEKLEDLLDTYDLQEAIQEPVSFSSWQDVKKQLKRKSKL